MNDVTLVNIISRDRFILLELYSCLLISFLIVLNSGVRILVCATSTRECMHLRRGNLNIDAPLCQFHKAGCEFSLEYSTEDRVSLFRDVAMQNLKHFVILAGKT